MCGEKGEDAVIYLTGEGSPPHVRGKVAAMTTEIANDRITPACAGKSQ